MDAVVFVVVFVVAATVAGVVVVFAVVVILVRRPAFDCSVVSCNGRQIVLSVS